MTDAPTPIAVSLSRPLDSETPRRPPRRRDSAETVGGAVDLKALAQLVLARDTLRDTIQDRVSRQPGATDASARQPISGVPPVAPDPPNVSAGWIDTAAERASIVEHHGSMIPRAWAEGFARLDPACPPGDVPAMRWQHFVDDVGLFLDSPFCAVAVALGWGSYDLFGCDRDRPFARIDQAGLLWLLNGDRLVALTAHTALIETATGARQTCRRKPAEPGRVLAWELA
jgi:hypothetical protein